MKPTTSLFSLVALLFSLLAASTSHAVPTLAQGYDAFEQGDIPRAVAIWTALAEQGNTTAQVNLGQLYRQGRGVAQDDRAAVKWYSMAAREGSETAQFNLLVMQKEGRATEEDLALAFAGQGQDSTLTDAALPGGAATNQSGNIVTSTTTGTTGNLANSSSDTAPVRTATRVTQTTDDTTQVTNSEAGAATESSSIAQTSPVAKEAPQTRSTVAAVEPVAATHTAPISKAPNAVYKASSNAFSTATAPAAKASLTDSKDWLWQTPARYYLLQITASSNRAIVEKYAQQHLNAFRSQLKIAHADNQGRDWFILLIGPFANREEADAQLTRLPPATLKDKPWARSVQSIQKAVAARIQD